MTSNPSSHSRSRTRHLKWSNAGPHLTTKAVYFAFVTSFLLSDVLVCCDDEHENSSTLTPSHSPANGTHLLGNVRQKRQDEDDDDDDGGGGGGASNVLAQTYAQTAAIVYNFLPQFFTTVSRFGDVANMALNGTDTPDIRSFLVKHGQSAVKLFKSFTENSGTTTDNPYSYSHSRPVPHSSRLSNGNRRTNTSPSPFRPQPYPLYSYPKHVPENLVRTITTTTTTRRPYPYPSRRNTIDQIHALYTYPKEFQQLHDNLETIMRDEVPKMESMKASINFLQKMLNQMEPITDPPSTVNPNENTGPSLWKLYSNLADRRGGESNAQFPISSVFPTKTSLTRTQTKKPFVLPQNPSSKVKPLYWMNMFYPNGLKENETKPKMTEPLMRVSPKLRGFPTRFPPRKTKLSSNIVAPWLHYPGRY